jgi:hypothetical protein
MDYRLIKFLGVHLAIGVVIGWCIAGLMLYTDYAGIGHLVFNTSSMGWALYLLFGSFGVTFGSVGMGLGIFSLNYDYEDNKPGGGLRQHVQRWLAPPEELMPVRVRQNRRQSSRRR